MRLSLDELRVETFATVESGPLYDSPPPSEHDGCYFTADPPTCDGNGWCTWFCPSGADRCSIQDTLDTCAWTADVNC